MNSYRMPTNMTPMTLHRKPKGSAGVHLRPGRVSQLTDADLAALKAMRIVPALEPSGVELPAPSPELPAPSRSAFELKGPFPQFDTQTLITSLGEDL